MTNLHSGIYSIQASEINKSKGQCMYPFMRQKGTGLKSATKLTNFYVLRKVQCCWLSNFTCRLTKEGDNQPKTIDWLELWNAVQNQVCE